MLVLCSVFKYWHSILIHVVYFFVLWCLVNPVSDNRQCKWGFGFGLSVASLFSGNLFTMILVCGGLFWLQHDLFVLFLFHTIMQQEFLVLFLVLMFGNGVLLSFVFLPITLHY